MRSLFIFYSPSILPVTIPYSERLAFYPKCRRFTAWSFAGRFPGGISDKTLLNGAAVALLNTDGTYNAF